MTDDSNEPEPPEPIDVDAAYWEAVQIISESLMGNGYILKEESDRRLTEQAVSYAQSEILMQMRRELNDAQNCVTAMVLSNGGEIRVDDSVLYSLKDYELESYRDEKHRCFVFQAVSRK